MSRRPDRNGRPARQARARRLNLEPLEGRELLTLYTVTTTADSGTGSLRAEIGMVNGDGGSIGADQITFDIPGSGVRTIALQSPLPAITFPVAINGTTQPGFSSSNGVPVVVVDGSAAGAGADGLTIGAGGGGSIIQGLSIVGFTPVSGGGGGEGIFLSGAGGNQILDDYIGVEPDGTTAKANGSGVLVFSANNTIGGAATLLANVVSDNQFAGVLIAGSAATGNIVTGNLLGPDAGGKTASGNQTYGLVLMAPGNLIGGTAAGAGNVISGDVGPNQSTTVGPKGAGILVAGQAPGNLIEGNLIGTDLTGTSALLPSGVSVNYSNVYGIQFGTPGGSTGDDVVQETVGGSVSGAGNLIAGNIYGIQGTVASSTFQGNVIGLDAAGTAAIPNGVGFFLNATQTTIGGATLAARNVVSGNDGAVGAGPSGPIADGSGLTLSGDSDVIEGNFVGTASSGVAGSGLGNAVGMSLDLTNSTIGSTTSGDSNVISGNSGDGIDLSGSGGDVFHGNVIGLDIHGGADGNGGNGIVIQGPLPPPTTPLALAITIGGTTPGQGNLIAHNGGAGVDVTASEATGITGVGIRGNTIFANAKLGIDTQGTGVPVPTTLFINGATVSNGMVTITGVYFDAPSTTVAIDLFGNAADPSGYGQGPVFLGTVSVTTAASGFAVFSATYTEPTTPYTAFSATYTGPSGNTSEFAANYPTVAGASTADLKVTATASSTSVTVGGGVILDETITNTGPSTANNVVFYDSLVTTFSNAMIMTSQGTSTIGTDNVFTASLGSLAPGASASVVISGMPSTAGTVADQPGASSTTFDPNYLNNIAQQTIVVHPASTGPSADLAIIQSASTASPLVGVPVTYTITVGNVGPSTSTDATVYDTVPAGMTIVSVKSSQGVPATFSGNLVTLNLGTVADLGLATVTIVAMPTATGSVTNLATVSGAEFDPVFANNRSILTSTVAANIHFYLAQPTTATVGAVGQPLIFTVVFENFGPSTATNVTLVDNLPSNASYLSSAHSQGAAPTIVNNQLTENFGTLAAGAVAILQLIVMPTAIGPATNVAAVYTPDVPSAAASVASSTVPIVAGPSVTAVNGHNSNAQIVLSFNEALNSATATNLANYQLVSLGTTGTGTATSVKISSVIYNVTTHAVTITTAQPLNSKLYYRLTVLGATASGVTDTLGRKLASTLYGTAGSNSTTTFLAGTLPQV